MSLLMFYLEVIKWLQKVPYETRKAMLSHMLTQLEKTVNKFYRLIKGKYGGVFGVQPTNLLLLLLLHVATHGALTRTALSSPENPSRVYLVGRVVAGRPSCCWEILIKLLLSAQICSSSWWNYDV